MTILLNISKKENIFVIHLILRILTKMRERKRNEGKKISSNVRCLHSYSQLCCGEIESNFQQENRDYLFTLKKGTTIRHL